MAALATSAGLGLLGYVLTTIDHQVVRAHPWSLWAMLALNVVSTSVLIVLALRLLEAIRDPPRRPGA